MLNGSLFASFRFEAQKNRRGTGAPLFQQINKLTGMFGKIILSTCVDVYIAAYEYAPNPALYFIYMTFYRARIPSPLPLHVAKTGRNHLNEGLTPLLPTGIGERF
jgi:hypothetical protein